MFMVVLDVLLVDESYAPVLLLVRPFQLLATPICFLVALYASFCYGILYASLAVFPFAFKELIGIIIGACGNYLNQKFYIAKWKANNYRAVSEARLPPMMVGSVLFAGGLFMSAWTGGADVHWIVPCIGIALQGIGCFTIFQAALNYLIDTFQRTTQPTTLARLPVDTYIKAPEDKRHRLSSTSRFHNHAQPLSTLTTFLSMHFSQLLASLLAIATVQGAAISTDDHLVKRASLTQVSNFGNNPSGVKMFVYVPQNVQAKPPVILVLHACAWNAPNFFASTKYGQLADQYGYVLVYGGTPTDGACWDVSSSQTLTHDGGSDSIGLANMVRYALETYNGDASRVFVTGESSGAMMTQVMAAVYPDLFAAGSAFSGVPAGCFSTGSVRGWNSQCAGGKINKTPAQWAAQVHAMYSGFNGQYPRMQIYHGDADTTLNIANLDEAVKEWSGVHGYSGKATRSTSNDPGPNLTKSIYGDRLQGILGHGIGHVVPTNEKEALKWFGIA
ncbi:unnamed protein product [Zymoseptoria tritici ST99CH_1E4]|nr:unnamed protein product [Zymoseptoria tritici ST99CH_1E4]